MNIKPSMEKVKEYIVERRRVVEKHRTAPQAALTREINPIIGGWCDYYSTVVSWRTFAQCKDVLWHMLRAWAKRRHPNQSLHWIKDRYWHRIQGREVFATREENEYKLLVHTQTYQSKGLSKYKAVEARMMATGFTGVKG
jgi:RNA-directed DNA polymerase